MTTVVQQGAPPEGKLGRLGIDRTFVMLCSIVISVSVVAIASMSLAALAFTNETTVVIPFVATFNGFHEASGSSAVTVNGSWGATAIVTLVLALPLWAVALRYRREQR